MIDKFYDPLDYRYFCLQAHYRKELTFSWEALDSAKKGHSRLRDKVTTLKRLLLNNKRSGNIQQDYMDRFISSINDDLNIPQVLALTWDLMSDSQVKDEDKYKTVMEFDKVLGLDIDVPRNMFSKNIPPEVQQLIADRNKAREDKDWVKSDELRDKIDKAGYLVKDGIGGTEVESK